METKAAISKKRTREEILAWLDRARQRKFAWEKRMQKKLEEEALLRKQAEIVNRFNDEVNMFNELKP